jgi:hypothetical protein
MKLHAATLALAATLGAVLAAAAAGPAPAGAGDAPRSDRWSAAERATLGAMMLSRLPTDVRAAIGYAMRI